MPTPRALGAPQRPSARIRRLVAWATLGLAIGMSGCQSTMVKGRVVKADGPSGAVAVVSPGDARYDVLEGLPQARITLAPLAARSGQNRTFQVISGDDGRFEVLLSSSDVGSEGLAGDWKVSARAEGYESVSGDSPLPKLERFLVIELPLANEAPPPPPAPPTLPPAPTRPASFDPNSIEVPDVGGAFAVEVTAEAGQEWAWTFPSEATWIKVVPSTGKGSQSVVVMVDRNGDSADRQAVVLMDNRPLVVIQKAPVKPDVREPQAPARPSFAPAEIQAPSEGGLFAVQVTTGPGGDWEFSGERPDWVTVRPDRGRGPQSLVVEVKRNPHEARQTVLLMDNQPLSVRQAAAAEPGPCTYDVGNRRLAVAGEGGRLQLALTTSRPDCPWKVTDTPRWIRITPAEGSGEETLTLTIEENAGNRRTGLVRVANIEIRIEQELKKVTERPPTSPPPPAPPPSPLSRFAVDELQLVVIDGGGDRDASARAAQALEEDLLRLGLSIRNPIGERLGGADRKTIRQLAERLDADLVLVVKASAKEADRLGTRIKAQGTLEVTVYRRDGAAQIASKTFRTMGDRSADLEMAMEMAVDASVAQMVPFLAQQMVERVGRDLVVRRVAIDGLMTDEHADRVESFMRGQPGVNRVDRIRWDAAELGYLELEIAMQPAVVANVPIWLRQVPGVAVGVEAANRSAMRGVAQ